MAGPANVYGHYVTTREEYAVQRYEGASTIFGQCECFYSRQAVLCFAKRFMLLENITAPYMELLSLVNLKLFKLSRYFA